MSDSTSSLGAEDLVGVVQPAESASDDGGGGGLKRSFPPTWQVFMGLLTAYLGLGMVVPVMAPLIRELGLTEFQGGLIFAVNYLMWVMASPFWGGRADRWGRKPIIILGLLGFCAGHVLFGLVADFGLWGWMTGMPLLLVLIATRAFAGALFSATPPAAQAYVVDRTKDSERTKAVAVLGAAAGIGSVVGPGLIWGLSQFESLPLSAPLYVAAALPILPTIALWWLLPGEKKVVHSDDEKPPVLWAWDKRIASVLVVGLILNVAIALLLFTLGFYLQDRLHLNEYQTTRSSSMAMLIVGVVAVAVQVGLLRVLTWSPVTLLRVGMSIMAVGTGLLVFSNTELTIDASVAVIGMGYAFAYPGFQAAISFAVGAKEQGAVAGLAAATGAVAFIIGPVVGTLIYQWEPVAPYAVSACVLLAGALLAMVHPRLKVIRRVSKGIVTVDENSAERHVSSELFEVVRERIEAATLPSERFSELRELASDHHFTSEQIREFMLLFTFGKDRVEVAAMLYTGVRDPENFYIVYKALSFETERAALRERVGHP